MDAHDLAASGPSRPTGRPPATVAASSGRARADDRARGVGTAIASSPAVVDALGAFARCIGLAFQLLDDVLDVSGPASRTGKHRGTDLLDGTVTLPLILAREQDRKLAALDLRTLTGPEAADAVCRRIEASGALDESRRRALAIVSQAKAELPAALDGAQRRLLELVADGVVERYS
jgi:geranylgeranyl pyrophosphate synthase